MMEESSDESAEIISNEEAAEIAKEMKGTSSGVTSPSLPIAPPVPLPNFGSLARTSTQDESKITADDSPTAQKLETPSKETKPDIANPNIKPNISAPVPIQRPIEASSQVPAVKEDIPEMTVSQSPQEGSFFSKLMSKMVEKTKNSMETMITTLDPGMKEVIKSGGDIEIIVTSSKEAKVGAVREAFQSIFGHATVIGMESQVNSAAQLVDFTAGLKSAEERIQNLRKKDTIPDDQPMVSVEGFIVQLLPDRWYEMSCLLLQDPRHRIEIQTYSQPTPVPAEYIIKAQEATPSDYPHRWAGLKATVGQIFSEEHPDLNRADWQEALTGVSRRESLNLAARTLAFMYKQRLPNVG